MRTETGANCEAVVDESAPHGFTGEDGRKRKKYGIPVGYDMAANRLPRQAMRFDHRF